MKHLAQSNPEWFELPTEQWISVERDRHHRAPWGVTVGGFFRARVTTRERAEEIARQLRDVIESAASRSKKDRHS